MNLNQFFTFEEKTDRRRHALTSFKAKANAKRSLAEKFADLLTAKFGSVAFLLINFLWFAIWISWNTGLIPGATAFDPFPFGLLTMVVSLEAIMLAIIVLISQNREAKVAELREEFDLKINTIAEAEISKLVTLTLISLKKQGVKIEEDPDLQKMLSTTNEAIERELEKELNTSN